MYEFLPSVAIVKHSKLPWNPSGVVLSADVSLYAQNPTDIFTISVNNSSIELSPADLPPGFELASNGPPYEIHGKLSGNNVSISSTADGASCKILAYIIPQEKLSEELFNLYGLDKLKPVATVVNLD